MNGIIPETAVPSASHLFLLLASIVVAATGCTQAVPKAKVGAVNVRSETPRPQVASSEAAEGIPLSKLETYLPRPGEYRFVQYDGYEFSKIWRRVDPKKMCRVDVEDCLFIHDAPEAGIYIELDPSTSQPYVPAPLAVGQVWDDGEVRATYIQTQPYQLNDRVLLDCLLIEVDYDPGVLDDHAVKERETMCPQFGVVQVERFEALQWTRYEWLQSFGPLHP